MSPQATPETRGFGCIRAEQRVFSDPSLHLEPGQGPQTHGPDDSGKTTLLTSCAP